jgi:hypothetical protein
MGSGFKPSSDVRVWYASRKIPKAVNGISVRCTLLEAISTSKISLPRVLCLCAYCGFVRCVFGPETPCDFVPRSALLVLLGKNLVGAVLAPLGLVLRVWLKLYVAI